MLENANRGEIEEGRDRRRGAPVSPPGRAPGRKARVLTGAGLGALVFFLARYYLGEALTIPSVSQEWIVIFFAVVFACGAATPVALRLLLTDPTEFEEESERDVRAPSREPKSVEQHDEHGERQVLEALERRGAITPLRAALETTLSVEEADRLLSDLARRGYLEVRAEEGRLVYSLLPGE